MNNVQGKKERQIQLAKSSRSICILQKEGAPEGEPCVLKRISFWSNVEELESVEKRVVSKIRMLEEKLDKFINYMGELGVLTDNESEALLSKYININDLRSLSARELEVFRAVLGGLRITMIAKSFYISPHTVRNHLRSIFRKLNIGSQEELLLRFRPGLFKH